MNGKSEKSAFALKLLSAAVLAAMAATAAGAHGNDNDNKKNKPQPLVLEDEGSFFVGGTKTLIQHSAGPAANRPGHIMKDTMYVRYMIPPQDDDKKKRKPNVVLWSGGCHVGTSFETTPDGRMGWFQMFVRAGYPTYVVDATWRGRSPISQEDIQAVRNGDAAPSTLPQTLTCDQELAAPPTPLGGGFRLYNSNFPIAALDQYLSQAVPDFFFSAQNGPAPNVRALTALLEKIGPSVVLAHSQGGLSVYPTVIARPDLFKAYLAVEALGSCTAITNTYPKSVPTLVLAGDQLDRSQPKPFGLDACYTTAQTHSNMTVWWLPDLGLNKSSHMMMLDKNNDQVFKILDKYIAKNVKAPRGNGHDDDDHHGNGGHDHGGGRGNDRDRDNDRDHDRDRDNGRH